MSTCDRMAYLRLRANRRYDVVFRRRRAQRCPANCIATLLSNRQSQALAAGHEEDATRTGYGACNFRTPDMVPRKPVRFLGLLGTLGPRNGSRVEFPETACGFDSGPGREPRELAIDEAN